ncbi:MAG TPA: AMP-binding protein [Bryobacteraceae bacterium]|nr:AMP-binding protein [Bryobacteraceae bacterium]
MSWLWEPTPQWIEKTNVFRLMNRLGFRDREPFLAWTREHREDFWRELLAETNFHWFRPYDRILDATAGPEWTRWFVGGRINIADNCLDRHRNSGRTAILWEGENGRTREVSFADLAAQTNRLANYLRSLGLQQGDRVALIMPMAPEIVTILYACFKLGLVAVPIFAGFGASAMATRLADSGARVVFTAVHSERRGKLLPLEERVRHAVAKAPSVEHILLLEDWDRLLAGQPDECQTLELDSEDPALLIYTSGTTGKPKGAVHTHAGTLAQVAKEIWLAFDHQPDDRFFWLTDIGWMMGPWAILGNHHFGGTIFLYDGAPDYPTADRLWTTIERHRLTMFGISPTAIRLLMKSGPPHHPMESLRLLGSTGEPWDEVSYRWYFEHVGKGRCPVVNICGGSEIMGSFLTVLPIQPLKPCSLGGPAPGMATDVVDESGVPVRGRTGYLVCTASSPSMTRGIWGDPERYLRTYWSHFPGWWWHGDWATVDEDGCWYVLGRADESMNVAGRKVGPAEVEEALIEHPAVAEAAVIGAPDELKGERIVAFVVLRPDARWSETLRDEIAARVAESQGPTLRPSVIREVPSLPKTQSGKIVRRLIRQQYLGEALGDTSTVENPAALEHFGPLRA